MSESKALPGTIITFYSFKGGTGRSMALANVACLLGRAAVQTTTRVLMIDMDLEAPGLHRYFAERTETSRYVDTPGILDYFVDVRRVLDKHTALYSRIAGEDGWRALDDAVPLSNYIVKDVAIGVDFIRAGLLSAEYAAKIGAFDWVDFFTKYRHALTAFRDMLLERYAYTLIDSRTGLTDVGGVCTMLLPEKLVAVFTPNRQSLDGVIDIARQAIAYRRASDDLRPLAVFPLPSRIEPAEKDLRTQWRANYQHAFETLFRTAYEVESCDLTGYLNEIQIPHMSYYAYGEKVAVLEETSDALSLRRSYEDFYQRLVGLGSAWELAQRSSITPQLPRVTYRTYEITVSSDDVQYSYNVEIAYRGIVRLRRMILAGGVQSLRDRYNQFSTYRSRQSSETREIAAFGRELYEALFDDKSQHELLSAQDKLATDERLALCLNFNDAPELASLPWELMNDAQTGALALHQTPIVRYIARHGGVVPRAALPIRILLSFSQPESMPPFNAEGELRRIQETLSSMGTLIEVVVVAHLTFTKLRAMLRQGFDVWHFVGHSSFDESEDQGMLLLEDEYGVQHPVSGSTLGMICSGSGLRLVVLNSGESARSERDMYSSLAAALVRAKVPAVVGMRDPISDEFGHTFSQEFYRAFVEGLPLESCLTEARLAIVSLVGPNSLDWSIPVLYTSTRENQLFTPPPLL